MVCKNKGMGGGNLSRKHHTVIVVDTHTHTHTHTCINIRAPKYI